MEVLGRSPIPKSKNREFLGGSPNPKSKSWDFSEGPLFPKVKLAIKVNIFVRKKMNKGFLELFPKNPIFLFGWRA